MYVILACGGMGWHVVGGSKADGVYHAVWSWDVQ